MLESRNRANAGPTAPAHGLCLQWVRYPAHLLSPESSAVDRSTTACLETDAPVEAAT
jgi:tRNA U38,U39,U40 pseudouridine synthase TruA